MILKSGVHLVPAHDRAQCGGAYSDVVLPHWAALVHGVERGYPTDIGCGETQDLSTCLDSGRRYPALDTLRQMQHGQQRRPGLRIPRSNGAHLLHRRLGDLGLGDAVVKAGLVEVRDEVSVPDELLRRDVSAGVPIWR